MPDPCAADGELKTKSLERAPGRDLRLLREQGCLLQNVPRSFQSVITPAKICGHDRVLVAEQYPSDETV